MRDLRVRGLAVEAGARADAFRRAQAAQGADGPADETSGTDPAGRGGNQRAWVVVAIVVLAVVIAGAFWWVTSTGVSFD